MVGVTASRSGVVLFFGFALLRCVAMSPNVGEK